MKEPKIRTRISVHLKEKGSSSKVVTLLLKIGKHF